MEQDRDHLIECRDCGLLQRLPPRAGNALTSCPRCNAVLGHGRSKSVRLGLACALLGLLLLGIALMRPAASLTIQGGRFVEMDLFQGVDLLKSGGTWELGLAVALTLFIMPALKLISVAVMSICAMRGGAPRWVKTTFATMVELGEWAMVDVFLLGAMVALVRMRAWGHVWFGPALFALGGVALCTLAIDAFVDTRAFWRRVDPRNRDPEARRNADAEQSPELPLSACHHCDELVRLPDGSRCPRCEQPLHRRKPHSTNRTWALVFAGTLLLLPANVLPVMSVSKMGQGGPDTLLSGTIELAHHGLWGLATIVFTASIVIPVLKLVSLAVLLVMTRRRSTGRLLARTRVYRLVAVIGRWSMIDIFATMTLVAIGRFGWLGTVLPGNGAVAFCGVVFVTMIAAESFDPRLMWDAAGKNGPVPAAAAGPALRPAPVAATNRQVST